MARAPRFIPGVGPWHEYRTIGKVYEIDFHRGRRDPDLSYWDAMAQVGRDAFDALKFAQRNGYDYVLFTHGWSTSRLGATTSRSMVRGLMRSPEATPFILRSRSIQHESVFMAAIRPLPGDGNDARLALGQGVFTACTVTADERRGAQPMAM